MRTRAILYWTTTAFLAFAVLSGGAAELAHRRDNVEGLVLLGYPVYFATIIGFWKVLGGVTVLAPRLPRLKEWAYAGIFFNMTGAAASHAASADAAWHVIVTGCLAVLAVASWALRPPNRTLGVLLPPKRRA
ncbi:MAG TPA: DoxX family protein [Gemmatimonadales bacterium]|nr:DoxX family protein [Gemmatimonadales bacterium]